jgi:hypothetical protein
VHFDRREECVVSVAGWLPAHEKCASAFLVGRVEWMHSVRDSIECQRAVDALSLVGAWAGFKVVATAWNWSKTVVAGVALVDLAAVVWRLGGHAQAVEFRIVAFAARVVLGHVLSHKPYVIPALHLAACKLDNVQYVVLNEDLLLLIRALIEVELNLRRRWARRRRAGRWTRRWTGRWTRRRR